MCVCICVSLSIISYKISVLHHGNTSRNVLSLHGILISTLFCCRHCELPNKHFTHWSRSQWLKVKCKTYRGSTCSSSHMCLLQTHSYISYTDPPYIPIIRNPKFIVIFSHFNTGILDCILLVKHKLSFSLFPHCHYNDLSNLKSWTQCQTEWIKWNGLVPQSIFWLVRLGKTQVVTSNGSFVELIINLWNLF